ncbi:MAG: hypothetical protein ACN4GG_08090 [Akkermansiaceae bacterium]
MVSQLGNEIHRFFDSATRGDLAGKNDNGVEVETILLSLETMNFDGSVLSVSNNNGFDSRGLDSLNDRTSEIRDGFSFYRGVASSPPPGALGFAQRRRIVVIDATTPGSPVVRHNDLPLSSGALGATNVNLIRAALNNAEAPSAGTTFEAWAAENSVTTGSNGPLDDPDQDGWENALEFSAGTDPKDRYSFPSQELERTETGFIMTYTRYMPAINLTRTWLSGPLNAVNTKYIPLETDTTVESTSDPDVEKVTITLPSDFGPFIRLSIELE